MANLCFTYIEYKMFFLSLFETMDIKMKKFYLKLFQRLTVGAFTMVKTYVLYKITYGFNGKLLSLICVLHVEYKIFFSLSLFETMDMKMKKFYLDIFQRLTVGAFTKVKTYVLYQITFGFNGKPVWLIFVLHVEYKRFFLSLIV